MLNLNHTPQQLHGKPAMNQNVNVSIADLTMLNVTLGSVSAQITNISNGYLEFIMPGLLGLQQLILTIDGVATLTPFFVFVKPGIVPPILTPLLLN